MINTTDLLSSNQTEETVPQDDKTTKPKMRTHKKDRSSALYSEKDYRALPRSKQLELAEKYWNGPVSNYDDGTFQFSYSHFGKICESIGFRKGIVDTLPENGSNSMNKTIYIDHGKRDSVEKKITLSLETAEALDELLGHGLANIERSKVVDYIMYEAVCNYLDAKKDGRFSVCYRPEELERLI